MRIWFQEQLKSTDLGIFSILAWLISLMIGGMFIGFGYMIGLQQSRNELSVGIAGCIISILFIWFAALKFKKHGRYKNSSLGISFVIFIFIEITTLCSWFSQDPDKYVGILFFYVLIAPAYLIYSGLVAILTRHVPRRVWVPCLILMSNFVYYSVQVMRLK